MPSLSYKELADSSASESSAAIQERVNRARNIQHQRFSRAKIYCNSQRALRHLRSWRQVDEKSHSLLERAIDKLGLSARACSRILKVTRTIADLDASKNKLLPRLCSTEASTGSLDHSAFPGLAHRVITK